MAPFMPGPMCTISPSTLLYVDQGISPRKIRWVECSPTKPQPDITMTRTQLTNVRDMCLVQNGGNLLLVATGDGVHAYNTKNDNLEWSVEGKLPGMACRIEPQGLTTDGRGHLFVCDTFNSCIQMFSADGTYLHPLLSQGEQGLGQPWGVRWSKSTQSLVVVHKIENHIIYHVSIIKVQ